ncbi:MAG: efflux RND transporter periplasmic adaptor subunit [Chitinophagaceae bacterium]|nr:MAG: efflux RND transporter periplasmic adaptor subunit [Chitinophagaceae bacterium]
MNTINRIGIIAVTVSLLIACGDSAPKGSLEQKKAQLAKLQADQKKLQESITALQEDIAKTDTGAAKAQNTKLVTTAALSPSAFTHYIDLQGLIEAENIAYVTPRGAGGQVREIYVKQGDNVRKGQLLVKLDNIGIQQQMDQLTVQLNLAKTLYDRRKNLWDQNIGTEVELLQAQSNVENLEKQMALLREQSDLSNVRAELSGVADWVTLKVGEFFSPQSATVSGIRIINNNNLKVRVNVPENYLDKVNVGANLRVTIPDINKTIDAKVTVKGKSIDPASRSFYVEAKIPASPDFRANQLANVQIQDYSTPSTITVPLNTIQNDDKGKFVLVAAKEGDKLFARKKPVEIGQLYEDRIEIKSGLQQGDVLITEGYQGLYDGQLITTSSR